MNLNKTRFGWKRIGSISALVVAVVFAVALATGPWSHPWAQTETVAEDSAKSNETAALGQPVTVEVTEVVSRMISQSRSVTGRVKPVRTVDIAFQVPGQIISIKVEPGSHVQKGDLIAQLDQTDFELAVDRAQASYDLANSELERASSLAERGVAADARLDSARAQFAQADVSRREAKRRYSQTQIVAPFDAIVARTFVEEYINVTSAAPVARLQDISEMRVLISMSEELAAVGRSAPDAYDIVAQFPAVPGYTAPLTLRSFATDADPTAQTYDVEFAITGEIDPRLLPGMTADVRISTTASENPEASFIIPVSAVDTTSRTDPSVWVYDETSEKVTRRTVRLGLPVGDEFIVLEGLEDGEMVVSGGWWRLSDDQTVTVSGR
ncbi:efflux RND transporter periplasmic adaptor subunit [Sulfitobacter sp. R18_1]|uniref:efflux RND transporter periplasmic adaptor subunit n=1 Tax=Sulfitobacter sp. R18_1 TaxID=2821104 RepID=UPI001ADA5F62|nr:efflux RND transporter periplasmic adaptor subunit [Sulfitobacter sp. R18_1]MBO9432214.1 efflux RND transporter periplasmic adaptor subunit [Sulfitobacter sp. R18_1]